MSGQAQIGNKLGITAVGTPRFPAMEISADGANTVTVSAAEATQLRVGVVIDIINKTTGALTIANRNVTSITSAGVVTYDGADGTAVPGTSILVAQNSVPSNAPTNFNGGPTIDKGFEMEDTDTLWEMDERLFAISSTSYSRARLNNMNYNDKLYALRIHDRSSSIK